MSALGQKRTSIECLGHSKFWRARETHRVRTGIFRWQFERDGEVAEVQTADRSATTFFGSDDLFADDDEQRIPVA